MLSAKIIMKNGYVFELPAVHGNLAVTPQAIIEKKFYLTIDKEGGKSILINVSEISAIETKEVCDEEEERKSF